MKQKIAYGKMVGTRRFARLLALALALLLSLMLGGCQSGQIDGEDDVSSAGSTAASSRPVQSQLGEGNFTGVWQRTGVPQSQAATITIKEETKTSFFFSVNARSGANVGTTEGVAHLLSAQEATCTYNTGEGATLTFEVKDGVLTVSVSNHDALGFGKGVTMDGDYIIGTPEYTDENWASEVFEAPTESGSYADLLDGDASLFLSDVMSEGTLVDQYEVTTPAGMMYRFSVMEAGLGADILSVDNGMIYIGLSGYADDYVLYTNDPMYAQQAPPEYQQIAAGHIQIRYVGNR